MKRQNLYSLVTILAVLAIGALWLSAQTSASPPTAQHATTATRRPATSVQSSSATHTLSPAATTSPVPTIGTPTAIPTMLIVNTATTVTVAVSITPTPITASVNLLRLGATGAQSTILGVMHDDGKNGDVVAGDGVYTLQLPFNEPSAGEIELAVSAAFQGHLQRLISPAVLIPCWNIAQAPPGSGITSPIVYPPSWVMTQSSPSASDGVNLSDPSDEEGGNGITVSLINAPLSHLIVDPGNVLVSQSTQTINGQQWTLAIEQEPNGGLRYYNAFLPVQSGVYVIGGIDSPTNEHIISTIISQFQP